MRIYLIFFVLTACHPMSDFEPDNELKSADLVTGDIVLDTRDPTKIAVGTCVGNDSGGCKDVTKLQSKFYYLNLAANVLNFDTAVFSYENEDNEVYTCHLETVKLGALNLVWRNTVGTDTDESKEATATYCYEEEKLIHPVHDFASNCSNNDFASGNGGGKEFKCGDKSSESIVTLSTKLADIQLTAECVNCMVTEDPSGKHVFCSACREENNIEFHFNSTNTTKTKALCKDSSDKDATVFNSKFQCKTYKEGIDQFTEKIDMKNAIEGTCLDLNQSLKFTACKDNDEKRKIKLTFALTLQPQEQQE